MAVDLPSDLPISAIELRPQTVVGVSRSPFTGHSQIYRWPGQWWEARVTLPPMHWEQAKGWQAFLTSMNGPEVAFNLPLYHTYRNTGITGGAAHGWRMGAGSTIGSAWLPVESLGGTGAPHVGDFLYIATGIGAVLHQVVNTVTTDANGNATGMNLWPRLRAGAPGHNLAFVAIGAFRLREVPTFAMDAGRITEGLTLDLIEAVI